MRSIVHDSIVPVILDTGASVSIISRKLQTKIGASIHNDPLKIHSFHSHADCSGYISIPITIGLITENVQFYVIPMFDHDLILGLDSIHKFNITIRVDYDIFQLIDFEGCIIENKIELIKNIHEPQINTLFTQADDDRLNSFLSKYHAIFSTHKYDVGCIDLETCRIDLKSDIPISLRPYRFSVRKIKNCLMTRFNCF